MRVLLAHGVGGREDLPLPFGWAVAGAAVAVVVSFIALGFLWKTPRLDGGTTGHPMPAPLLRLLDSRGLAVLDRLLTLVIFAYVLLKQNSKQTVTVWLDTFITTKGVDWGALMAASTLVALPIVVLFAIIQRKVAMGITAGAVKG